jgi:two-component system, response regulator YesN
MISIVIADDEKLIRAGIKKILTDSLGVVLTVFEARNGSEAYELSLREQPDVVITDIRMPGMDGIELMKKLVLLERKPAIIVLSGYDDFTYAKAAIESGALSYILKPVDKKELVSAVSSAITTVQKEEKARNEQTLRTIMSEGHLDSESELSGCRFPNGMYCITSTGRHCSETFTVMLHQVQYYILEQKKDFISLVVPREALYLVESDMTIAPFTTGISSASSSVMELRKLRRESYSALLQSFFPDEKKTDSSAERRTGVFYYSEEDTISDFSGIDQRYEKCIGCLDFLSSEGVQKTLGSLFDFSAVENAKRAGCLLYLYDKIVNNLFNRFPGCSDTDMYLHLKSIMIENIWQAETLAEWKGYVCDYAVYLAALLNQHAEPYPFITKALDFINNHYTENINMTVVANRVSINYTWFSEKFKEQTGVNFNDYLKRLRMEQAKHLLEKGCYKVYEVAAKAGFGDVKYFMKSFRETTGMSPGEWARAHGTQS